MQYQFGNKNEDFGAYFIKIKRLSLKVNVKIANILRPRNMVLLIYVQLDTPNIYITKQHITNLLIKISPAVRSHIEKQT